MSLVWVSACASTRQRVRPARPQNQAPAQARKLSDQDRERLVSLAHQAVGRAKIAAGGRVFRADCSGTIRALFALAKIPLGGIIKSQDDNDVKSIYRYVQRYGQVFKSNPRPGDLVFFHNTYNRSGSGQMNDALTHIGLVEKVDRGTVHFVHHMGRSIIRSRMNLANPKLSVDPKSNQRINHVLRRAGRGSRSYTAGELFAGFGRL